jgi:hypothetical protein
VTSRQRGVEVIGVVRQRGRRQSVTDEGDEQ